MTVVSSRTYEKCMEDLAHYKKKCEEYCKRIFELGEELKKGDEDDK